MDDDEVTNTPVPTELPTAADPAPTETAPAEPAAPNPPRPASKVLTMPTAKIGEIKRDATARGRREVQVQYDNAAKDLGYDSHEQMMTAFQQHRAQGTPSPTPQAAELETFEETPQAPEPETDPALRRSRKVRELTNERTQLLDAQRRTNRQRAHEERQKKALQEKLDAQSAEHELRFAAMRAGIQDEGDVDYAVNQLRRSIAGKSADELKGFDPADFFGKTLRKARPYLYGVQTTGATTSPASQDTGENGGPATPHDPAVQTGGQSHTPVDARKMNDQDYATLLKSRGYNHPSAGMPI